MSGVEVALEFVEAVATLRFPAKLNDQLQNLMDRNNDGGLNEQDREALAALVELSETMALVRAQALRALGRRPA